MRTKTIGIAAVCAAILFFAGCSASKSEAEPMPTAEILPTPVRITEETETEEAFALPDFSALVRENADGESVFDISVSEFIDCFNAVYRQTHDRDYLLPTEAENWYIFSELSPCFGYSGERFQFSQDRSVWPMPTISVYASDSDEIYELRMTFSDHGYQDDLYELYRELCFCALNLMFPELSESESETLFEMLYAQSDENFFGDHAWFDDPERPALSAVYRIGSIGMYGFYGSGTVELCFIPLTEGSLARLQEAGTPIPDGKEA